MSHRDTDDVLDFINSLPDSKSNTPKPKSKVSESNEDFLEFLDELSAHEKTAKPAGGSKGKFEPKKKTETEAAPKTETASPVKAAESREPAKTETNETGAPAAPGPAPGLAADASAPSHSLASTDIARSTEPAGDPLASISSWWSTEGSSKVSSLWGSLTSNAHQLSESTYQIASNTSQQISHQRQKFLAETAGGADAEHILHLSDKLNSMLVTMSEQIRDGLIDKEDELMNVLLVYDLNRINYLDSLCAQKFNKVMGQVEGGIKVNVSNFNHKHAQGAAGAGYCDLGLFSGKAIDGEKLCFANLESSIKDYVKVTEAEAEAQKQQQQASGAGTDINAGASHEINKSNVFIAIQTITAGNLDSAAAEDEGGAAFIEANSPSAFSFTMILKDITNNITVVSKSQPFPLKWARWLSGQHEDVDGVFGSSGDESVDPSEWVKEWIHDGLGLCFAVLAQEYVTKRMGI